MTVWVLLRISTSWWQGPTGNFLVKPQVRARTVRQIGEEPTDTSSAAVAMSCWRLSGHDGGAIRLRVTGYPLRMDVPIFAGV